MKELTHEEIDNLIGCPKLIIEPPRKEMVLDRGSYRNGMRLQSKDSKDEFSAFMRINRDFEENFSIGLVFYPRDIKGEIHLLRFNGPHGDHRNFGDHFGAYHYHIADPENIHQGLKAERTAYVTSDFASYDDALMIFAKKCHIIGMNRYFPTAKQLPLPFDHP